MSEHLNNPQPSATNVEAPVSWVRNGQRITDLSFLEGTLDQKPQPSNGPLGGHHFGDFGFLPMSMTEAPTSNVTERRKRRIKVALGLTAAFVAAIVSAGYSTGFNLQPLVHSAGAALGFVGNDAIAENGITMHSPLVAAPGSFSADQCTQPGAIHAVLTVSGNYPIIGKLTDKEHATPYNAKPYMTSDKENDMTKSDGALFDKFITKSHFPEISLNNMPLGLKICDLGGGIEKDGNRFIVTGSKLTVMFEDPSSVNMLKAAIKPMPQLKSKTVANLDPSKGEWVTYPANGLFLYNGKDPKTGEIADPVLHTSVTALVQTMQDPQVLRTLIAIMEEQAVKDVNDSVANKAVVTYPDGKAKNLSDAISQLLIERLGADPNTIHFNDFNYAIGMDVPIDHPTTKKITEKNNITNLDLDPKNFRLTAANVVYGFPDLPKQTPSPSPTPTPTSTKITTP